MYINIYIYGKILGGILTIVCCCCKFLKIWMVSYKTIHKAFRFHKLYKQLPYSLSNFHILTILSVFPTLFIDT